VQTARDVQQGHSRDTAGTQQGQLTVEQRVTRGRAIKIIRVKLPLLYKGAQIYFNYAIPVGVVPACCQV